VGGAAVLFGKLRSGSLNVVQPSLGETKNARRLRNAFAQGGSADSAFHRCMAWSKSGRSTVALIATSLTLPHSASYHDERQAAFGPGGSCDQLRCGLPPRIETTCLSALSLRSQGIMSAARVRRHRQQPIQYRDLQDRVWSVSEIAALKVVSPALDGPNLALVIRFEREGEERLARWIGGDDWQEPPALDRLFAEADPIAVTGTPVATPTPAKDQRPPEAPIAMRLEWIREVADMGPDALDLFEQQTFQQWDRGSLAAVRRAIDARRRELAE